MITKLISIKSVIAKIIADLDIKEDDNIDDRIKDIKKFKSKKFVSNKKHFIEEIKKLIDG